MSDEELVSLKNNEFDFGYLLIQKARLTHQEVDTLSDWGNYIQKGSGAIFNTSSSSSNVHPTLYDAFKRFCKIGGGLIVNEVSSSPHHRKNDLLKYHHICSKEGLFQSVLVVEESTLKQKYYNISSPRIISNLSLRSQLKKENKFNGAWVLTKSGNLVKYSKTEILKTHNGSLGYYREAGNQPLAIYESILFIENSRENRYENPSMPFQRVLFSFRDEISGYISYDQKYYSPSKFLETKISRDSSINFSVPGGVVMIIPNPLNRELSIEEARTIVTNNINFQFKSIRNSKDANVFVMLFESYNTHGLAKKVFKKQNKSRALEQKELLNEASSLTEIEVVISNLTPVDSEILKEAKIKLLNAGIAKQKNALVVANTIQELDNFIMKYSNNDLANLITQAKRKKNQLEIEKQEKNFSSAYSSDEWYQFIIKYSGNDVGKLIDKAKRNYDLARLRENKAEQEKLAKLKQWREGLNIGDTTFCGRVIERKDSMIKVAVSVQLPGFNSEQWLHQSEVYMPKQGCINRNGQLSPSY